MARTSLPSIWHLSSLVSAMTNKHSESRQLRHAEDGLSARSAAGASLAPTWEETSYFKIAARQIARGFGVAPVHPGEKRGILWNQFSNPATTISEVIQHAKDFPDHNVCVSSHRGIGRLFFLDIDAEGVIEQIEQETGYQIPETFTVQSRPGSAPYKRHYYFRSTPYSFEKFGGRNSKEVNRRDLKLDSTRYDLKGIGRGGFVVAEGSIHPNGEIYSVMTDGPVIDVPDWLVDWLTADIHRFRSERAKLAAQRKTEISQLSLDEKKILQEAGVDSAYEVSEAGTYGFVRSRTGSFLSLGCTREEALTLVISQVKRFCANGSEYVKKHRDTIRKEAFDKAYKIGNAAAFKYARPKPEPGNIIIKPSPLQMRRSLVEKVMRGLPSKIAATKAYDRLESALKAQGLTLDRTKNADLRLVARTRKTVGYRVENIGGAQTWIKGTAKKTERSGTGNVP